VISARANFSSTDTRVHVAGAVVVDARASWDNRPVIKGPGADKAGKTGTRGTGRE
jgi:hypothetical protein